MADISSLTRARPIETTLEYETDSIALSFDGNKVTPRWMNDTMVKLEERNVLAMADALSEVIISWDVTDGENPFPPTGENISVLSFGAINSLYEKVCASAGPSDAEGNALPASSDAPLSETSDPASETSLNGSATSPSPTPSASLPVT